MKYETIINDLSSREELINRVEVLDRVKRLLLIPELQFTTLQGVAEFYEVDNKAVSSLVTRHREEFNSDGLTKISRERLYPASFKKKEAANTL